MIDLISVTEYAVGDNMLSDLETCEWVVMRGINVMERINDKMNTIVTKGKWKSISTEVHRLIKYNYKSKLPVTWNDVELVSFRSQIETRVLTKIPYSYTSYCIGKFKLLMNGGLIKDDQDPHFDYRPKIIL